MTYKVAANQKIRNNDCIVAKGNWMITMNK